MPFSNGNIKTKFNLNSSIALDNLRKFSEACKITSFILGGMGVAGCSAPAHTNRVQG